MALTIAKFNSELGYDLAAAVAEKTKVTVVADVAGSLNNKYFQLASGGSAVVTHHVWFNVNGAGVNPAPGTIAVPVAVATNATATVVAAAVAVALDGLAEFVATSLNNVVTVTNAATGHAAEAVNVNAGVVVEVLAQGRADDQRYVLPYAAFIANPAPDLTAESDQFGYIWKTLAAGYRMTGMTFAYDGANKVVLVIGDSVKFAGLTGVAGAYIPA